MSNKNHPSHDYQLPDDRKYGIGMAAGYSEESPAGSGRKVNSYTFLFIS